MEGTWRQRRGIERGGIGVRNAILYRTREVTRSLALTFSSSNLFTSIYPSVPLPAASSFAVSPPTSLKDHEDRRRRRGL